MNFEKSLNDVGSNRNLADTKVCDKLIRDFIGTISDASSMEDIQRIAGRYGEIVGSDTPPWHGNEEWRFNGSSYQLSNRFGINQNQMGMVVWYEAFMNIAHDFLRIAIAQKEQNMSKQKVSLYTDRLVWFWTAMLVGTVNVLYPNARIWSYGPIDEGERDIEDLQKSYVSGYYRKDGTWVKPHSDNRVKRYELHVYTQHGWTPQGGKQSELSAHGEMLRGRFHAMVHPQPDDDGNDVIIHSQIPPSPLENWESGQRTAIATPECDMPESINGIPVSDWEAPETLNDWANVEGQIEMDEEPIQMKEGKGVSTGVIIMEDDGRIWTIGPTNQFGGYIITFPKGRIEPRLPLQANAIKEVYEESGLKVQITGVLGDFERTTTVTRMYVGKRVAGNPANMGWESQFVALIPKDKIKRFVKHKSDQPIAELIEKM